VRILSLINQYPPFEPGGQGYSCQQVVEGLRYRGHTAVVLTSRPASESKPVETDGIYRSLYFEMDLVPLRHALFFFTRRKARERHNLAYLERFISQFTPDVIFIWGMWNLPHSLPALAEAQCPGRVVYRFADYWPTLPSQHELYWRTPGRHWYSRLPKRIISRIALAVLAPDSRRPPLKFEHAICVSEATRNVLVEAGVPVSNARIIYTGLDIPATGKLENWDGGRTDNAAHTQTGFQKAEQLQNGNLKLLYAGRLSADKGVDTAIKAVANLVFEQGLSKIKLSLAGSGSPEYQEQLRHLVTQVGLDDHVSLMGRVPPEEMPFLMRGFDALLVPSIWPEPFARVVLEGMTSGLVVVATPTGGTTEIVVDNHNGLLFAPSDSDDLARKIARLVADPTLRARLARAGQETVRKRFTLTAMLDEVEGYLREIACSPVTDRETN
jgi:glycosyltransferase involved in cell wall biosynthesis